MIKLVTLAALAAFAAVPANATEIHVSLVGKSAEQVDTDIAAAARTVCRHDLAASPAYLAAYASCVRGARQAAKVELAEISAKNAKVQLAVASR